LPAESSGAKTAAPGDGVVILHGLGHTPFWMRPLELRLQAAGYTTLNLGYAGRSRPFAEIIDELADPVAAFAATLLGDVHFVGHSMGGLVIRALLHARTPANLGRVVMLGTPNHGSAIADLVVRLRLTRVVVGKAAPLLSENRTADLEAVLGTPTYPLGIVAGDFWVDGASGWLLARPNDGKVTVASTRLEQMADHITLPVGHTFMPWQPSVVAQTIAFLCNGRFDACV